VGGRVVDAVFGLVEGIVFGRCLVVRRPHAAHLGCRARALLMGGFDRAEGWWGRTRCSPVYRGHSVVSLLGRTIDFVKGIVVGRCLVVRRPHAVHPGRRARVKLMGGFDRA
jgi:hypothetical protein